MKKRKLFTLGLTVFMTVSVLCSNVAQASGMGSMPEVTSESYVAEETSVETVSESDSEEACEVAVEEDSATAEISDEMFEVTDEEALSEGMVDATDEEMLSEEGEEASEVVSEIPEEPSLEEDNDSLEEVLEESSETSSDSEEIASEDAEEIASEDAEENEYSEIATEEESTEQNESVEVQDSSEEISETSAEENSETEEIVSEEIIAETSEEDLVEEFVMPTESVWTSENFEVKHSIVNSWEGGYQGEVVITNIGNTTIEDWNLMFNMDTDIYQIWNASIDSNENGLYIIKNDNWNANISAGQSRSFGYLASYDNAFALPESYGISGSEKELAGDSYEITYEVTDMWEDGYVGNITITNLSDKELRNWKLSFDLNDEICDIWNATIHSNENGKYVLHHAEHNAVIGAGGSVTIGFRVQDDELQMYPENYAVKVIVHSEIKTECKDDVIGIAYFEDITEDEICMADDGIIYAQNQLNLVGEEGTTFEQVAELGEEYGFEIVGYIEFTNDYQIKFVNDKTYEELNELIDELEQNELILEVNLNLVCFVESESENEEVIIGQDTETDITGYQPSDQCWETEWYENQYYYGSWGVKAIDAPLAWEYQKYMSPVKMGIYDGHFVLHEDIVYEKIWNFKDYDKSSFQDRYPHGTIVAGIMAATFDNGKGIAGVAGLYDPKVTVYEDVSYRHKLYVYDYKGNEEAKSYNTITEQKYTLALMIGNGVRVINFSNGIDSKYVAAATFSRNSLIRDYIKSGANIMDSFLMRLVERGYDFVIVQSAGNENSNIYIGDDFDSEYRYATQEDIAHIAEDNISSVHIGNVKAEYISFLAAAEQIRDRVIVVGAFGTEDRHTFEMCEFSNVGSRVDIVAPGYEIESTILNNDYRVISEGTSLAAPFVSGTAVLVYSVNPELSGPQVKEIIVDSSIGTLNGISSYEHVELKKQGISCIVPQDSTEYKCLNAGAAVRMALQMSGKDVEASKKTGFIMGNIGYEDDKYVQEYGLEGIEISAYRYSTDGNNGGTQEYEYITTTDMDGYYSLTVNPGTYRMTIYKEGFVPVIMDEVTVKDKKIDYLDEVLLVKDEGLFLSKYEITGEVVDAITGESIAGAEINFRKGWNVKDVGKIEGTVLTDTLGNYSITLKEGNYTAEIYQEGYFTGYMNIIVHEGIPQQVAVLVPKLAENELRIVMTWNGYEDSIVQFETDIYDINTEKCFSVYQSDIIYDTGNSILSACYHEADIEGKYSGPRIVSISTSDDMENYIFQIDPWIQAWTEPNPILFVDINIYFGNGEPKFIRIPMYRGSGEEISFKIENGEIVVIDSD